MKTVRSEKQTLVIEVNYPSREQSHRVNVYCEDVDNEKGELYRRYASRDRSIYAMDSIEIAVVSFAEQFARNQGGTFDWHNQIGVEHGWS